VKVRQVLLAVAVGLVAAIAQPSPAYADTFLYGRSTTSIQLREDLDGVVRAPLYETFHGGLSYDLGADLQLSSLALVKLGTVLGHPGGTVDLYLLNVGLHRYRGRLRLVGGRQLLRTARGVRIVDGVSFRLHPAAAIWIDAAAGWLRDMELDDFSGGSMLLQGGAGLSLLRGTLLGAHVGFRAGPTTTPRLDARLSAEAVLPAPWAPKPWIDASFRLDAGGLRNVRGGVVLTPIHLVELEVRGRVDQVVDHDGTLARRILADLTDSPVASLQGIATLKVRGGFSATASYQASHYRVGADLPNHGHGADVDVRLHRSGFGVSGGYVFRSSYGGLYHSLGLDAYLQPHRAVRLEAVARAIPFRKVIGPWGLAQWYMAQVSVHPNEHLQIVVGGEYRAGATLQHDLRLNASVTLVGRLRKRG